MVGLVFQRPFQSGAEHGMLLGIELLHEGVVAQDKFVRAEFLHISKDDGKLAADDAPASRVGAAMERTRTPYPSATLVTMWSVRSS